MSNRVSRVVVEILAASSDGKNYGRYPHGDRPEFDFSIMLYAGSTSGPTSGGETGKGDFYSIFLTNPGAFADWGVTSHLYIGGHEVDNYRHLSLAVGSGTPGKGNGVGETFGIWELAVQVGALGTPTQGTPLPITVSVNGNSPINFVDGSGNCLDLDGHPIQWTPNPGLILFVDPVNGVNPPIERSQTA